MSAADVPADRPVGLPAEHTRAATATWISWVALAMMTTTSVASLRPSPTMAVYGLACVFLLTPVVGIMLITASLGGMLTWLAGPSKGLLHISRQEGYLPPFLQRLNKHGIQQNILIMYLLMFVADTYPDAEIILMGAEEPRTLIHAPNESVDPNEIAGMAQTEALFLRRYPAARG